MFLIIIIIKNQQISTNFPISANFKYIVRNLKKIFYCATLKSIIIFKIYTMKNMLFVWPANIIEFDKRNTNYHLFSLGGKYSLSFIRRHGISAMTRGIDLPCITQNFYIFKYVNDYSCKRLSAVNIIYLLIPNGRF